jgi:SulP family sulfate permease
MLVALPSSIACGLATYTVLGNEHAGEGAMAGILGAAALGLVAPFVGRTRGLISAPCAPAAAVLSATITDLAAGHSGTSLKAGDILPLLALAALFSALLQVLYGAVGGGRLIKFIPYPVVSGYLSGVGVLIALGQLPKLFGFSKGTPLGQGLLSPGLWRWEGVAVGLVTILLMELGPRITRRVPAAIMGLAGGIAGYFLLAVFRPALLVAEGNPLVIGPIPLSGSILQGAASRVMSIVHVHMESLHLVLFPALTLSVLLSIDTLKSCVGLDTLTRHRSNSNRELVGQGLGNLASFLVGGMAGSGAMGPSMVNISSGGKTWRAGMFEGGFVVLALFLLSPQIAWVPIGALAGILLVIAWRMLDRNMIHLWRDPHRRLDFLVIAAVVIVAVAVDLIAAAGVGIALAILLFIRDQVRSSVIRRKLTLKQVSSKTRRLAAEREALDRFGDQGVLCQLQDNLFFGTTDQLFSRLEPDLRTARYLLFDMRRVQSMDYTAAHLFQQMHAQLSESGGRLLFCGVPSVLLRQWDLEKSVSGQSAPGVAGGVMVSETLDGALEWMEEHILKAAGLGGGEQEPPLELKDFYLLKGLDDAALERLTELLDRRSFKQGEKVFLQGDTGDDIYLVRRGSVRILIPLEGGQRHHLATIGRGDFFGELAFLDRGVRSAEAEAKSPTEVFVLSRARFGQHTATQSSISIQVLGHLARVLAHRLRQTDEELRLLEER